MDNGKFTRAVLTTILHEGFHDYENETVNNATGIHAVVSVETRNAWIDQFAGALDVPYGADPVEFYAFMFSRDYRDLAAFLEYDKNTNSLGITPYYTGVWADYERILKNAALQSIKRGEGYW
jgi:hypothetical protein